MPRAAVALASQSERSDEPPPPRRHDLESQLADLNRQVRPRRFRPGRTHLVLLGIVVVAAWLLMVFANTLADVDRANSRQESVAAESAALERRLAAERRELALVQTDAFQALQARSFGMGEAGEQIFGLAADTPPPDPITPLGRQSAPDSPEAPLDAWLQLLFGS